MYWVSPVHLIYLCYARQLLRPRRNLYILTKTNIYYCLLLTQWYQLPHHHITRLNHFTLSHSGSHTPQSTLKPNITALAPRFRYQLVVTPLLGRHPTYYILNAYQDALCVCTASRLSAFILFVFIIYFIPFSIINLVGKELNFD